MCFESIVNFNNLKLEKKNTSMFQVYQPF